MLHQRVKELTAQVKILTLEKAALEAEVEVYRKEKATGVIADGAKLDATGNETIVDDPFFRSGDGIYCSKPDVVLENLHGNANPLCVTLSEDESILMTGGADSRILLTQWGAADDTGVVPETCSNSIPFQAPVIAIASSKNLVAAGSMDGSVKLVLLRQISVQALVDVPIRHAKYVKSVAFYDSCILISITFKLVFSI